MALLAKLYTISGLEIELASNKRKLAKILKGVPPDGKSGKHDAWFISTVLKAQASETGELVPSAEKARLDKARANLAELDLAIKEGRLVPADAIEKAWGNIVTEIRTRLMAIPASTAPRITANLTTVQIESIIREQIDEALQALSSATIVEDSGAPEAEDGNEEDA